MIHRMRTTLTLDDDVAILLERLRKEKGTGLKELINEALRQGLARMKTPGPPPRPFRTTVNKSGRCLLPTLDCVSEVIDFLDAEDDK